jgi:hypothetical protein
MIWLRAPGEFQVDRQAHVLTVKVQSRPSNNVRGWEAD